MLLANLTYRKLPNCSPAAIRALAAAETYLQRRTPTIATIAQAAAAFRVSPAYVSAALAAIRSRRDQLVWSGELPPFSAAYPKTSAPTPDRSQEPAWLREGRARMGMLAPTAHDRQSVHQ